MGPLIFGESAQERIDLVESAALGCVVDVLVESLGFVRRATEGPGPND